MAFFNERLIVTALRWTARILGIALVVPVVLSIVWVIRDGGLDSFVLSLHETLIETALWTMTLGLLVGWKWEGIGSLLTLGGVTLLGIVDYQFWPHVETVAGLVAGLLYLVCWWRSSRGLTSEEPEQMEWPGIRVLRRFSIPLVLVLAHAVLVILTGTDIALSSDPEAGMVWIIFAHIDYPISLCFDLLPTVFLTSRVLCGLPVLLLGTIQWGIIGLLLQGVVYSFRQIVTRSE